MRRLSLLICLSVVTPAALPAQIVTWTFSGTLSAAVNVGSAFTVGDAWSASFSLNYGLTPTDVTPNRAGYVGAVTDFTFHSGSFTATQVGASAFYVYDDSVYGLPIDLLETTIGNVTAPAVNGLSWNYGSFQIQDSARFALSSTAIPYGVNLAEWTNESGGRIVWGIGPADARIEFALHSVTPALIPEPAT